MPGKAALTRIQFGRFAKAAGLKFAASGDAGLPAGALSAEADKTAGHSEENPADAKNRGWEKREDREDALAR